jgi:hypothetical protein
METVWCFGVTRCLHFQGMKISSSEYWITTFSGNPLISYHWTLSHFPVTRSVSFYVRCSLRKNKSPHCEDHTRTSLWLWRSVSCWLICRIFAKFGMAFLYQICWARVSFAEIGSGEVIFHISWAILITFSAGNVHKVLWMGSEFYGNHFSEGHCNWEGIYRRANVNKILKTKVKVSRNRPRWPKGFWVG